MNYENTEIYRTCRALHESIVALVETWPRGHSDLASEIDRATRSIENNFREGCGRLTPKDRAHFFVMSRASAYEVAGELDQARTYRLIDDETRDSLKDRCDHIAGMLWNFGRLGDFITPAVPRGKRKAHQQE